MNCNDCGTMRKAGIDPKEHVSPWRRTTKSLWTTSISCTLRRRTTDELVGTLEIKRGLSKGEKVSNEQIMFANSTLITAISN